MTKPNIDHNLLLEGGTLHLMCRQICYLHEISYGIFKIAKFIKFLLITKIPNFQKFKPYNIYLKTPHF